jgi:hypothetical protein
MYPLHGEPKQLMNFGDFLSGLDVSPDGKTFVVARGALVRDAMLITGFR